MHVEETDNVRLHRVQWRVHPKYLGLTESDTSMHEYGLLGVYC